MNERTLQERNRTDLARRRFSTGLCAGLLVVLAGCGGSGEPDTWDVAPNRSLSLSPGATFNLAATLPASVAPGGIFDVDPSGTPLPSGMTLNPSGLLTVSSSATGGTAGVVFRYTPPA